MVISGVGRGRCLAAVVAMGALLGACQPGAARDPDPSASSLPGASTGGAATEPVTGGGSLRFGLSRDPASIDPRFVADEAGALVVAALFDSLVALDDQFEVMPAAASDWTVDEKGTRITFTLREGATFHDGTPVTADDVVRTFNRIADGTAEPRSFVAHLLEPIVGFGDAQRNGAPLAGLTATGRHTVEMRLRDPFPAYLEVLANPSLAPVPASAEDDPEGFADRPVGNGPFAMSADWQHDQFIRVGRVGADIGADDLVDEVVFQIYTGESGAERQWEELQEGLLHVGEVPPNARDEAIEQFGISTTGYQGPGLLTGVTGTLYYYGFNTRKAPFDRARVRRAVSLLIDRERIVDQLLDGTRRVATSIVAPPIPGSQPGVCGHCRFSPSRARELVEASGGLEALDGPLRVSHDEGRTHAAIAAVLADTIREALGVEVEVVERSLAAHVRGIRAGEIGLFRLGWQPEAPSPGNYLVPLFHSDSVGEDNVTRYSVDEVDDLLDRARATMDPDARQQAWREAEARILDDAPIAPVFFYRHTHAVRPEVDGLRIDALGRVDLTAISLDSGE